MDLVKKNMVSIVCGVIALLAVGAVFYPVTGMYDDLRKQVEDRKNVYTSLESIAKKERKLPVTAVGGSASTEAPTLGQFPNPAVITKGEFLVDQLSKQSAAMLGEAVKLNEHKVLEPGALPDGSPLPSGKFLRNYRNQMLIDVFARMNDPVAARDLNIEKIRAESSIMNIMQAGFPPTEAQITEARNKVMADIATREAKGPGGQVLNQQQLQAEANERLPKVADTLKSEVAAKCKVYVDATSFDPYIGWQNVAQGAVPDPVMVLNAQVGLWIHEDVARAIADANKDAKNVIEAPVKHLIKIDLLADEIFTAMQPGAMVEGQTPTAPDPNAKNYVFSPTGRTSNAIHDVVLFDVRMNVDAEQVPRVLQEMSRNRLITVLSCSLSTVDSGLMQSNGYFYGSKPVVLLEMRCEALLLRKWTEPLMPLRVKQALGIAPPPTPPAQ